ncbi:MAG: hypothetical protein ACYCUD_14125, partial [Candidatus Dormibacteria bacterium]
MIYLDSSALVKLLFQEPESGALTSWLTVRAEVPKLSIDLLPTDKSGGFPSRLGCLVGGFHRPRRRPGLYRVQADPLCP